MRTSKYTLFTIKEKSINSMNIISYQLMLRSGMIRKLTSGIFIWLPIGLRILSKLQNIIREEMNRIGAIEMLMPIIQPSDLWYESERINKYDLELLRFTDRNDRLFVLGPTNEELITKFINNEIRSYKSLPLILYQIQTKFRDEIRPRSGIIRSREFLMKDAYSFHINEYSLNKTYYTIYNSYKSIFTRIGLKFHIVQADNGLIGGNYSHEFHILNKYGEDSIVLSTTSKYAANIELAKSLKPILKRNKPKERMRLIYTPNIYTIKDLIFNFKLSIKKIVKIIIINIKENIDCPFVALMIRGDHTLNHNKVKKIFNIHTKIKFIDNKNFNIMRVNEKKISINIPLIIDYDVANMNDFVINLNIDEQHCFGINWERDIPLPKIADLRNVINGDVSTDGKGKLNIFRSIEIGHIFQLGTKYSKKMKAIIQNEKGDTKNLYMGCYGIGITRLISAIIEQNHDEKGILWPTLLAPFSIAILPININKMNYVKEISENIYQQLIKYNIDVLIDDRDLHPGIMFAEMDLIGIPHIIIISDNNLKNNNIEYKNRHNGDKRIIKINKIIDFLLNQIYT